MVLTKITKKAFTIMEIMTVVIIVGVIAVFSIPNFTRAMEKAYEDDAISQLAAIHTANEIYRAQDGNFWPASDTASHPVSDINSALGLSIIPNGMDYACRCTNLAGVPAVCAAYSCTASRQSGTCVVTITQAALSTTNPSNSASCVGL